MENNLILNGGDNSKQEAYLAHPRKFIKVWIDQKLHERFREVCQSKSTNGSAVLRQFVSEYASLPLDYELPSVELSGAKKTVNCRLTPSEYNQLAGLVSEEKTTIPRLLLRMIRSRLGRGPQVTDHEIHALGLAVGQLRRVGVNLNQLVNAVNRGHFDGNTDLKNTLDAIHAELVSVSDCQMELLRKVNNRE